MATFFEMGGYAAFVWPSWIIGLVVLLAVSLISFNHDRRIKIQLSKLDALDTQKKPKTQRKQKAS